MISTPASAHPDERVLLHLRQHGIVLVVPGLALLGVGILAGLVAGILPPATQPWSGWILAIASLVAILGWSVVPFLNWLTTTYTITEHRVMSRTGILTRSGHDLPLARIRDVAYRSSIIDRMFGSGVLMLTTAAEDPVVVRHVPQIEGVYMTINGLLFPQQPPGRAASSPPPPTP